MDLTLRPSLPCVQASASANQRQVIPIISTSTSTTLRRYGLAQGIRLRSNLQGEPVIWVCSILSQNQELKVSRRLPRYRGRFTLPLTKSVKYRGLDLRRVARLREWHRILSFQMC